MGNRLTILVIVLCVFVAPAFSQPQTCLPAGFQKKLIGVADDRGTDVAITPFNEYLVAGFTNSETGINQNYDAVLIKLNPAGNIIWQKRIGGSKDDDISKLLVLKNGNYVAMGTTKSFQNPNGNFFAILLDSAGNILNTRELNMIAASHSGTRDITSIVELENGDLAFCGNADGINTDVGQPLNAIFNIVGLLDKNLEMKWFQRMRLYYAESGYPMKGLVATKSSLIAIISNGVMKISLKDGSLIGMQKQLQFLDLFDTIQKNGDRIIIFSTNYRAILDTNLNVISADRIGFYLTNYRENILRRTDQNGNLIWSYLYHHSYPKLRVFANSQLTIDNGIIAVGTSQEDEHNFAEPHDIILYRTDSLGRISECPRSRYLFDPTPVTPEIWELHMRFYPLMTIRWTAQFSVDSLHFSVADVCNNNCQLFELTGRDTLCNFSDTLVFNVIKNPGCIAMTDWDYDSSMVRIVRLNDSSLALVGKKEGKLMLRARSVIGCQLLQDSLQLNIFDSPANLNLGPDVELCTVKMYTLNARKGFRSYLWNDGSTDSILTVVSAGRYFVEATDYCGKIYRDTVNVTESPTVIFDIGPDRMKCNEDTLVLAAPDGFTSYRWAPDYNIFGTASRWTMVFPSIDTVYSITATRGNGCIVKDSIRITVNHSPKIDLGIDTSLCKGDSMVLDAGSNFTTYNWNTGSSRSSIVVKEKGKYAITATDLNGCVSKDELLIIAVNELPVINLGPDTFYCKNEKFELVVRSVYHKYEWSNNLTSSTIPVHSPGQYWVKVTSKEGCVNKDTINLTEKECLKGVYFPNAFTPNNDRTNNTFKPIVQGNLETYYLVIYNRWGQKVFETRDPKRGWDGTLKGKQQDSQAFIWTAQYKFTGNNEKTETLKGSLMLIR